MTAKQPTPEESYWLCPLCGPRVACDEDGCCVTCGSQTFGSEEEWFVEFLSARDAAMREEGARRGIEAIVSRCEKRFPNSTFWRDWRALDAGEIGREP